jgi:predicted RNase H-like nuclease (RuvC/YqgF family)
VPPRLPAAILIQQDKSHVDKQQAICLEYAEANNYQVRVLCFLQRDCIGLILDRTVTAVITAVDPGAGVAEAIMRAGGRLIVVRESCRKRPDADDVADGMKKAGLTTQQIATILREPLEEVKRRLFRRNLKRRQ